MIVETKKDSKIIISQEEIERYIKTEQKQRKELMKLLLMFGVALILIVPTFTLELFGKETGMWWDLFVITGISVLAIFFVINTTRVWFNNLKNDGEV